jgi:hypothetical protein
LEVVETASALSADSSATVIDRLRARRASHEARPMAFRVAWALAGGLLTLCGVAMLVLPGPAFAIIPAGLAMLALEFDWALRLLDPVARWAENAKVKAAASTPLQRAAAAGVFVLLVAAAVWAALTFDIPLLPV